MAENSQRDFLDSQVLGRLGNLPLFARGPMQGSVSGRHQSPHRGSSVEFAEYRKYVPGDDTRRLDWRAYARSDRFYIKEFEADTNLRCYILLDTSGSMGFGSEETTKMAFAKKLAGTLAYLAVNQGDGVGLTCASTKVVTEIPARRSARHLQFVFNALAEAKPEGETGLVAAMHDLAEKVQQRALVVVISDLFAEPAGIVDALQHLRFRKHDVSVFHLWDKAELEFKFDRPLRFVDMEDDTAIIAEPNIIANRYLDALEQYIGLIKKGVSESATDYHVVKMDEDYEKVLANFLLARTPKRARN